MYICWLFGLLRDFGKCESVLSTNLISLVYTSLGSKQKYGKKLIIYISKFVSARNLFGFLDLLFDGGSEIGFWPFLLFSTRNVCFNKKLKFFGTKIRPNWEILFRSIDYLIFPVISGVKWHLLDSWVHFFQPKHAQEIRQKLRLGRKIFLFPKFIFLYTSIYM